MKTDRAIRAADGVSPRSRGVPRRMARVHEFHGIQRLLGPTPDVHIAPVPRNGLGQNTYHVFSPGGRTIRHQFLVLSPIVCRIPAIKAMRTSGTVVETREHSQEYLPRTFLHGPGQLKRGTTGSTRRACPQPARQLLRDQAGGLRTNHEDGHAKRRNPDQGCDPAGEMIS